MCGSMVDIQSPTAEIRRGKKRKKEEEEEETTGWKYIWPALLHRAAINDFAGSKFYCLKFFMTATSAFGLGRRSYSSQRRYLHRLCTARKCLPYMIIVIITTIITTTTILNKQIIKISVHYFGTTSNENYFCIHVNHSSLSDLHTWWVMPVILLEHSRLVS